jgi:hypothetical protein
VSAPDATDAGPLKKTAEDEADEALQDKLDVYIKCLNSMTSPLYAARKEYRKMIPTTGPKAGLIAAPKIELLATGVAAGCVTSIADAKAKTPRLAELEAAGQAYGDAAKALDAVLVEAKPYFDKQDFKKDGWKKGAALHPRATAAFDAFTRADTKLHEVLDGITRPLAKRRLARIAELEGMKVRYHRKHVLITARELVETEDPPVGEDEVDVGVLESATSAYATALDDLAAYGSAHRAELDDSSPDGASNYDAFLVEARAKLTASQSFLACLRTASAPKVDPENLARCPGGSPMKLQDAAIAAYNKMIRVSNARPFAPTN